MKVPKGVLPHGIISLRICKYLYPNVRIVPQLIVLCASLISVATSPDANISLSCLDGTSRTLNEWVTTFHLLLVVVDPYTHESSWIIETGGRILRSFKGADCRGAWMVLGNEEHAKEFLGPWASEILTFVDPDLTFVQSIELGQTPAILHFDQSPKLVGSAEGWNPSEWKGVASDLSTAMSWSKPIIPDSEDPSPYSGVPVTR